MVLPNEQERATLPADLLEQLETLKLTPDQAHQVFIGISQEIDNPSVPPAQAVGEYGLNEAVKTLFPDSTDDDLYGYIAAFTLGGRINRIAVEEPRAERYEQELAQVGTDLGGLFEGLPDNVRDIFESDFEQGSVTSPFSDFGNRLAYNLNALQRGETVSEAQRLYSASADDILDGNVPLGQENIAPAQNFDNIQDYLNFELSELQQAYPEFEEFGDVKALENYASLKGRQLYLQLAGADRFELLDNNIQEARFIRTIDDVNAPARFGRAVLTDIYEHTGYLTPPDLKDIINAADPELNTLSDLRKRYPILLGKVRFRDNEGGELFKVGLQDVLEVVGDPLNAIPLKGIDDLFRFGLSVPKSVAQYGVRGAGASARAVGTGAGAAGRALTPAVDTVVNATRAAAEPITAATVESLRALTRTPVAQEFVRRVRTATAPLRSSAGNVESLRTAVGRALGDDYTLELTSRVLSDEGVPKAGLINTDRRIIRASYAIDNVDATVHHEVFHAVYPRLNDELKGLVDQTFSSVEQAAEAYGSFVVKRTIGNAADRAFQAITDLLRQVQRFFIKRGYTSAEQVFQKIRNGDAYRNVAINANDAVVAYRDIPRQQRVRLTDSEGLTSPVEAFYEVRGLEDLVPARRYDDGFLARVQDYPATYRQAHQRRAQYDLNFGDRLANPDDTLASLTQRTRDYNRGSIIVSNTGEVLSGTQRYNLLEALSKRNALYDDILEREGLTLDELTTALDDVGLTREEANRNAKLLKNYLRDVEKSAAEIGIHPSAIKRLINEGKVPILVRTVAEAGDNLNVVKSAAPRQTDTGLEVAQLTAHVVQIKDENLSTLNATFDRFDLKGKRLIDLESDPETLRNVSGELLSFIPQELRARFTNRSTKLINLNGLRYVSGVITTRLFVNGLQESNDFLRRWIRPDTDFLLQIKPEFERRLGEFLDLRVKLNSKQVTEEYDFFKQFGEVVKLQSNIRRENTRLGDFISKEYGELRLNTVMLSDQQLQGAALGIALDSIDESQLGRFFDSFFREVRDDRVRKRLFSDYHPPFHYAALNKTSGKLPMEQARVYDELLQATMKAEDIPTEAFVLADPASVPGRAGLGDTFVEQATTTQLSGQKIPKRNRHL